MTGAVLQAGARTPEQLYGTADVEHLLAASEPFDVTWDISVDRMGPPECVNNAIQVDPDTGEIVRLRCEEKPTTPPSVP
ncbi:hypothetical protein ACFQX6_61885 [Streptosporangium lutulentum]